MNRLTTEDRARILTALSEGMGVNTACRMTGASKNTVLKLLADVDHMRGAPMMHIRATCMRTAAILCTSAALAGCAAIGDIAGKGAFRNRASCTSGGEPRSMIFTSFWFRWLGFSSEIDPADAERACGAQMRVIVDVVPSTAPAKIDAAD